MKASMRLLSCAAVLTVSGSQWFRPRSGIRSSARTARWRNRTRSNWLKSRTSASITGPWRNDLLRDEKQLATAERGSTPTGSTVPRAQ